MNNAETRTMNILVVGDPESLSDVEDWFPSATEVTRVEDFDRAIGLLRIQAFDVVVCKPESVRATGGGSFANAVAGQTGRPGEAMGLITPAGTPVCGDARFHDLPAGIRRWVARRELSGPPLPDSNDQSSHPSVPRRFPTATDDTNRYELTCIPLTDPGGQPQGTLLIVSDLAAAREWSSRLDAVEKAGRELLSVDVEQFSRLSVSDRLSLLEQRTWRWASELMSFENLEARIVNRHTGRLEVVLAQGMPGSILNHDFYVQEEGSGIRGYVAAHGRSYVCPDVSRDPRAVFGIDHVQSTLTVPLMLHDRTIGVAHFESLKPGAFGELEVRLTEAFARHLATALHVFELLVLERQSAVARLGQELAGELTGPLNDILTESQNLFEEYVGHDATRRRIQSISEKAALIRDAIRGLTCPKPGLAGNRRSVANPRDPLLTGKRVLVADDEEIIRDTVRDVLTSFGCEVQAASDGASAVALIAEHPFDLVLSDIRMPAKSGYEVFAAAKEADPRTPVILTTGFGYDPNHSIIRARREGLSAVLFKPFKIDQLLDEIRMAFKSAAC